MAAVKGSFTDFEDALRGFESGITVQSMAGNSPPVYNGTQVISTEDFNKYKAGTLSLRDVQYTSTNFLGFIGYQFGDPVMQDMGYYNPAGAAYNSWQGTFTGRDNITSLATFKTSLQEAVILREFSLNLHYADYYLANPSIADAANPAGNRSNGTITNTDHDINWNGNVYPTTLTAALGTTITVYERPTTNSFNPATAGPGTQITITLTGLLAAGHLTGWGGVYDLLYHHVINRDETGTPSIQYMTNYGGYDTSFFGATEAQALATIKAIRGYDNVNGTNNELPLAENLWQKDFNNDGKIGTTPVTPPPVTGDQTFVSTSANETFTGTAGGNNTVNYSNATSGVTVDLSKTAAQAVGGGMGSDTLISIENIVGSAFADRLIGNSAANTLNGGAGNDVIVGGGGNDDIRGGAGLDTVMISSTFGASKVTVVSGVITVTGPDGTDTLRDVERVQFTDGVLAFDIQDSAGSAYRMYQAAFNRTPDKGGVSFWTNVLDKGNSIDVVAQGFVKADEFKLAYGTNPSNSKVVDLFYQNVLGRAGETEGRNFWIGTLDAGASVATVLKGFANSPENHARVDPVIAVGISLDAQVFVA